MGAVDNDILQAGSGGNTPNLVVQMEGSQQRVVCAIEKIPEKAAEDARNLIHSVIDVVFSHFVGKRIACVLLPYQPLGTRLVFQLS